MPIEHEAKTLAPSPEKLLLNIDGQKLREECVRRYGHDVTPGDESQWIRLQV